MSRSSCSWLLDLAVAFLVGAILGVLVGVRLP